jgi:hypothetical protein
MKELHDKALGKYFIGIDPNNYTVYKPTTNKDAKGNIINLPLAYCSTLQSAIKEIIKLRAGARVKDKDTLSNYIKILKELTDEVKVAARNW